MNTNRHSSTLKLVCAGLVVLGIAVVSSSIAPAPLLADEIASSQARGGRLYDKWYKVIKAAPPTESHTAYPADANYADKPDANWRCKECHGWDYMGKDGAYASGKHASGIIGINGMAGADPASIIALLKGELHGYDGMMDEADFVDLANFVSGGQVDMDLYIDRGTKMAGGDAALGEAYYNTICAGCHGMDGKKVDDMPPMGALMGNPWEVMHKILNGQPAESMPALRALDPQVVTDIVTYLPALPKE
jgi:thiosulfate dehydrogenase